MGPRREGIKSGGVSAPHSYNYHCRRLNHDWIGECYLGHEMHFDHNLRVRVLRLLGGVFHESDFNELFLALRQRPRVEPIVEEVGNFVAHREVKNQGIVTKILRNFGTVSKFHYGLVRNKLPLDAQRLPPIAENILRINIEELDQPDIKKSCGLKRKPAKALLNSLLQRMTKNDDGTLALPRNLAEQENNLLQFLLGSLRAKPAFDDEALLRDFIRTLEHNKLLEPGEKNVARSLKAPLALFVLTRLHQSSVILHDGSLASLIASGAGGLLHIIGSSLWEKRGEGSILGGTTMFITSLKVAEYCEGVLSQSDDQTQWLNPIELLPTGKIREISV